MKNIILPSTKNNRHPDYAYGCWFCKERKIWKTSISSYNSFGPMKGYFRWSTPIDSLLEEDKQHVINELTRQGRDKLAKSYQIKSQHQYSPHNH